MTNHHMKLSTIFSAFSRLATVFICMALTACATTTPLGREVKSQVHSVSVNESVPTPDSVFFFGTGQALAGALGGGVGAAVGTVVLDDAAVLKNLLLANDIRVGELLRSTFEAQLRQANVFPGVVRGSGDAQFNLSIARYGLFKKGPFEGALRGAIWGTITLVGADGKVLWQKSIHPEATEDRVPAHSFAYYQSHPDALRESFRAASSILVTEIIEDLKR